jgi:hypothetical protein
MHAVGHPASSFARGVGKEREPPGVPEQGGEVWVFEEMVFALLRGERAQVPDNRPFAAPDSRTRPVRARKLASE